MAGNQNDLLSGWAERIKAETRDEIHKRVRGQVIAVGAGAALLGAVGGVGGSALLLNQDDTSEPLGRLEARIDDAYGQIGPLDSRLAAMESSVDGVRTAVTEVRGVADDAIARTVVLGEDTAASAGSNASRIAEVSDRIRTVERALAALPAAGDALPSGVVISSMTRCDSLEGWSSFAEATGRFLLGAGEGGDADSAAPVNPFDPDRPGALKPVNDGWAPYQGGEKDVVLDASQTPLPDHDHDLRFRFYGDGANEVPSIGAPAGTVRSDPRMRTGYARSQDPIDPHNNMPPYIALYFCKKN